MFYIHSNIVTRLQCLDRNKVIDKNISFCWQKIVQTVICLTLCIVIIMQRVCQCEAIISTSVWAGQGIILRRIHSGCQDCQQDKNYHLEDSYPTPHSGTCPIIYLNPTYYVSKWWCPKTFLMQNDFGSKKILGQKNFGSEKIQKNFWLRKMAYQNFGFENLGKIKLGPKIYKPQKSPNKPSFCSGSCDETLKHFEHFL